MFFFLQVRIYQWELQSLIREQMRSGKVGVESGFLLFGDEGGDGKENLCLELGVEAGKSFWLQE